MPHQCTNCGRAFDDGSKEMLSGCPDCGGNKFQFHPADSDVPDEPESSAEPPEPPGPDSSVARTVGNAAATVRDIVGGDPAPPDDRASPSPEPAGTTVERSQHEDAAQADARSEVVSPDEIPAGSGWDPAGTGESTATSSGSGAPPADRDGDTEAVDRPDLSELREELNEQFESIKVLNPGQYELNLMELYDREEYIIALQEDGRYSIQVPETWQD